jgi:hypothetical protein
LGGWHAVKAQRGDKRRDEAPQVRVAPVELGVVVVVDGPEDRARLRAGGRPARRRHRLPSALTDLVVGDALIEQQPDEHVEQRDLLVGRSRGLGLEVLEFAQGLAVRVPDRLVGAVQDLVDEPDRLVVAEAQQRGVAQTVRAPGQRRGRRAPRERGELTAAVRRHPLKLPVARAELAQERDLLQLRDDLRRTR